MPYSGQYFIQPLTGIYYTILNKDCTCTDVRDEKDRSPLHWACAKGHKDVVEYLVEKANCDVSEWIKLS